MHIPRQSLIYSATELATKAASPVNQGVCLKRGSSLTSSLAAELAAPRPPRSCSSHSATKPRGNHVFASSSSPPSPPAVNLSHGLARPRRHSLGLRVIPPHPDSLDNQSFTTRRCKTSVARAHSVDETSAPSSPVLPDASSPVAPAGGTHPSSVITRGTASRRFAAAACERNCATAAAHPRHRLAAVVHAADTKRAARQRAGIKAGSSHPVEDGGAPWTACVKEVLERRTRRSICTHARDETPW